jgi:hypothetical protein
MEKTALPTREFSERYDAMLIEFCVVWLESVYPGSPILMAACDHMVDYCEFVSSDGLYFESGLYHGDALLVFAQYDVAADRFFGQELWKQYSRGGEP